MKLQSLLLTLFSFITLQLAAQPAIEWAYYYGGSGYESGNGIIQNFNNFEHVVVGVTQSNDFDVSGNHNVSSTDYWVLRLNTNGTLKQQKCIGGSGYDDGHHVIQTADGGYMFMGAGSSSDGDMSTAWGSYDYWIVKTDTSLNIQWEKNLGGTDFDVAFEVIQTNDGGYVVVGESMSSDGDVTTNLGMSDVWVAKVDGSGNLLWEKTYGGSDVDKGVAVAETSTGNLVVAAWTKSQDGDVGSWMGNQDCWLLMLDSAGNLQWEKSIGGSGTDITKGLLMNTDGTFMILAETGSVTGDVSFNHGMTDYWLVRMNPQGNIVWEKTFGGTNMDVSTSLIQTTDGGFLLGGRSMSNDGDVTENKGGDDYWVAKVDADGNLEWEKSVGGTLNEGVEGLFQANDGGFLLSGYTASNDGDVGGNNSGSGSSDMWIVKLEAAIGIEENNELQQLSIYPNPGSGIFQIEGTASSLVRVLNVAGQQIDAHVVNNQLDLRDQPAGVYFLQITAKQETITQKLILIR